MQHGPMQIYRHEKQKASSDQNRTDQARSHASRRFRPRVECPHAVRHPCSRPSAAPRSPGLPRPSLLAFVPKVVKEYQANEVAGEGKRKVGHVGATGSCITLLYKKCVLKRYWKNGRRCSSLFLTGLAKARTRKSRRRSPGNKSTVLLSTGRLSRCNRVGKTIAENKHLHLGRDRTCQRSPYLSLLG